MNTVYLLCYYFVNLWDPKSLEIQSPTLVIIQNIKINKIIHSFDLYFSGKNLVIVSGDGSERVLSEDDIRKRHDEAQAAKLATMKGSGRFG